MSTTDTPRYFTAWGPDGRSVVRCVFPLEPLALRGEAEEEDIERRHWTAEEDAIVMHERGKHRPTPHREIAARLGRSQSACEQRWSLLRRRPDGMREAAE